MHRRCENLGVRTESPVMVEALESRQLLSVSTSSISSTPSEAPPALVVSATTVYGSVTGVVGDANGKPIAGASVRLINTVSGGPVPSPVTTNANGTYTFTSVATGTYIADASATGYLHQYSAKFTVNQGANTGPTFKLTAAGIVSGLVTNNAGTPLAGVLVTIAASPVTSTSFHAGVLSDASGKYTFPSIPVGTYTVNGTKSGYYSSTSATFTVVAGPDTAPTLKLKKIVYGSVTGVVDDTNGKPIAGATVQLINTVSGGPVPASVTTNSSGVYTFPSVVAGTYIAEASKAGYLHAYSAKFTVVQGVNTVPTFHLVAAGIVSGTVTDKSGVAVAGALVTIAASPVTSTSFHAGVLTDASGKYTFDSIPVGTYTVSASKTGYVSATSSVFTVVAGPDTAPLLKMTYIPLVTAIGPGTTSSPGPVLSTLTPKFSWNPVTGITGYEIYLTDLTTSKLSFLVFSASTTSWTPTSGTLVAGHKYSWNIRAYIGSTAGTYKDIYYFQT